MLKLVAFIYLFEMHSIQKWIGNRYSSQYNNGITKFSFLDRDAFIIIDMVFHGDSKQ